MCDGKASCSDADIDGRAAAGGLFPVCNGEDSCKGNTKIKCPTPVGSCEILCGGDSTSCQDATVIDSVGNCECGDGSIRCSDTSVDCNILCQEDSTLCDDAQTLVDDFVCFCGDDENGCNGLQGDLCTVVDVD